MELTGGRVLGWDDVGDPAGVPVVYLHGTPDSRAARHPDDGLAAGLGVRLLALDRPGFGETTPLSPAGRFAGDLAALADAAGVDRLAVLGWSSGGFAALAAAAELGERCARLTLVGTVPPVEAYRDSDVLAALGPGRRAFVEMALELTPDEVADEVAPHLVPLPLTPDLARAHVLEGAGPVGRAELEAVPGAVEALVRGLEGGVAQGPAGIAADLREQLGPGPALDRVTAEVDLVHGELDGIAPPAVGRWLADRLPRARLEVVEGAGHHLLFPRWPTLLAHLARH